MNKSNLRLIEFSLTLHVKESVTHEFFNLHPHILAYVKAVPVEWSWEKGAQRLLITPGFCSITYDNGVRISGNKETVNVSQNQDLELGGRYHPPEFAGRYISELAPDTFQTVELNWEIETQFDDPKAWIAKQFFQPDFISESWSNVEVVPVIRFEILDSQITFGFFPNREETGVLTITSRLSTSLPAVHKYSASSFLDYQKLEEVLVNNLLPLLEMEDESN